MTPINEVPSGKFCRFAGNVVYVMKNNLEDRYTLAPIGLGKVPEYKAFNAKVYVYKRIRKDWVEEAWHRGFMDNLSYVENLAILKSYENK